MQKAWVRRAALAVMLSLVFGGAGTEARAQYNRETPIVLAVRKTREGIVTLKVEKKGSWGRKESVGTGVIVDERGYVVTNRHVVGSADRVTAVLFDGTEAAGQVLAEDATHDLAIVKVQVRHKLQALPLGPAGDLMVGETVIAIGAPFGYSNTVSTGIVSALGRDISLPGDIVIRDVIQTNASINPGNSGGPLLNINGDVVGINVALREGAQGIAFALNADMVLLWLSRQLSALKVSGVQHGLSCVETVARPDGADRQKVLVRELSGEGPAAAAGLRPGDEILRVADFSVRNRFDLERSLWGVRPGDKVDLIVVRQGEKVTVSLTLGQGAGQVSVTQRR